MSGIAWRWEERDFGFRFRGGKGRQQDEYYQARAAGEYYIVPKAQRKLKENQLKMLASALPVPQSPKVVANPWLNYERDWDWIASEDGLCLNYAGCLDQEEIDRQEDRGVQRAMELVLRLVEMPEPAPVTSKLIQQIHKELLGDIYPFAGRWRTVSLHKGEGPTKWPLPPCGIQPLVDVFERDVLARTPFISQDDKQLFSFISELMNELLAIHPFREGNGRTAFIVANLLLMQNDMLPLNIYDRRSDQARYYAACESGRILRNYAPLAALIEEWEDQALARWEADHG